MQLRPNNSCINLLQKSQPAELGDTGVLIVCQLLIPKKMSKDKNWKKFFSEKLEFLCDIMAGVCCVGPVEAARSLFSSCSSFSERTPEDDEGKTGRGIGEFSIVTKRT